MNKDEYKCAYCGGVFQKDWSEEEAKKEAEGNFGKPVDEWEDDVAVICDDCYQLMLPANNPDAVERTKKII